MLLLDGVFVPDDSEPRGVRWVRVPAPSTEEVQALVVELARDLEAWLSREGYGMDEASEEDEEDDDSDALLFAASIAGRVAMGRRAGAKVRSLQSAPARPFRLPPRCGEASGFNLHAAVVIGQGNRDGLERLCRYVLRPPLAKTRLARRGDGVWTLTLRKAYANGTTQFVYSELELTEKLAELVPPAQKNGVSYHGVFAPRHRLRNAVVPEPPVASDPRPALTRAPTGRRSRWHPWADLLWRVSRSMASPVPAVAGWCSTRWCARPRRWTCSRAWSARRTPPPWRGVTCRVVAAPVPGLSPPTLPGLRSLTSRAASHRRDPRSPGSKEVPVRFLTAAALAATLITLPGCLRAYTVTAGAEEGHYVLVMQKASGQMKVLDCRSKPDGKWNPECKKVKMD